MGKTLADLQVRTTLTTTPTTRTVVGASPYQTASLSKWNFPISTQKGIATGCGFTTAPPPGVTCWWPSLETCRHLVKYFQQGHRFGSISAQIQAFREEDLKLTSQQWTVVQVSVGNMYLITMIIELCQNKTGQYPVNSCPFGMHFFFCHTTTRTVDHPTNGPTGQLEITSSTEWGFEITELKSNAGKTRGKSVLLGEVRSSN